jgi:hypothetical protein
MVRDVKVTAPPGSSLAMAERDLNGNSPVIARQQRRGYEQNSLSKANAETRKYAIMLVTSSKWNAGTIMTERIGHKKEGVQL